MSGFDLAAGTLLLALTSLLIADAARRVAGRLWPDDITSRIAGGFVLGISGVVVLLEILGTAGWLAPQAVAVASALLWVAGYAVDRRRAAVPPGPRDHDLLTSQRPLEALAFLGLLALSVLLAGALIFSVAQPRPHFDTVAFHLPVAVQWLQKGNIRFLPYETPISLPAHYPANNELLALWMLIPTKRDFLVQVASVPALGLTLSGTVALARELGARPLVAFGAALAFPTLPRALSFLVGTNMQDLLPAGALVAAAAFIARDMRTHSLANVVAAGLALGLAAGSRYASLFALLPAAVPFAATYLADPARRRRIVPATLVAGGSMILTGAYFYVRNQMITGSPVYPQSVPWKHIVATEKLNFRFLKSYAELGWAPHAWSHAVGSLLRVDGPVAGFLVLAVPLTILLAASRRERTLRGWTWAFVPALAVIAFAVTPGSAGFHVGGHLVTAVQELTLRYGVFVAPLAGAVLAAELSRRRSSTGNISLLILSIAGVVSAVALTRSYFPWMWLLPAAAGSVAVIGGAVMLARRLGRRIRALAAIGVTISALLVSAISANPLANHFDGARLASGMQFEDLRSFLRKEDDPVAFVGFCQMYALYGPALDRRIEYLTGDDGGINRPFATTFSKWLRSLRSHGSRSVVIASDACYSRIDLPYRRWLRSHPGIFTLVGGDEGRGVYRVIANGRGSSGAGLSQEQTAGRQTSTR